MTDASSGEPVIQRDDAAVSSFVERFASILVEAGFQRMAARVFVALLASESGRLTAAELAQLLQASPAAISGAVRYLTQLQLASRHREPGSRRDYFQVDDDVWYQVIDIRLKEIARWGDLVGHGVDAVGEHSDAGVRLRRMAAFFSFMREGMPDLLRDWHDRAQELS